MNRWVLLEHRVLLGNLVDIHYDFLVEDESACLTWKFFKIPLINKDSVQIVRQPNHRLIWLTREEYTLSRNRGFVKKIDHGKFIQISSKSLKSQDLELILDGDLLNGYLEISGNVCRLKRNI